MQKVVKQLETLIEANDWENDFKKAIERASTYDIPSLKQIKGLPDYLKWLDDLLTWVPVENHQGREIYDRICEFYFILDQPSVRRHQNAVMPHDETPPLTELSSWMVDFARAWGAFLDTPESITPATLKTFANSPRFNLDEYMAPPSGYRTFNQLFARHVKPGMRPVADLCNPNVVVAPADSTFVGWWQINDDSRIMVKSLEWSIGELLEGSPYAERFRGGIFTHSFLNTTDYHRLHVPVGGRVVESRYVHGQVYLDVTAVPVDEDNPEAGHTLKAIRHFGSEEHEFDAQDATGYQFAQARGLLIMETPIGLVAVLPIGMAQVSSVVMTAEVGKTLHKGEEFSYFQFGGSDCVMLFEAASNVSLIAQPDVHYNQGQCIGHAYPNA